MEFNEKPQWYETEHIEEIDGFEPDQYGNVWYNAKFKGNAESCMWLAKNKPEENKKYYGHMELTKSGKRLRFKTDKVPEDEPKPANTSTKQPSQSTDENIARSVALKAAVDFVDDKASVEYTLEVAGDFLTWLKGTEISKPENKKDIVLDLDGEPLPEYPEDL